MHILFEPTVPPFGVVPTDILVTSCCVTTYPQTQRLETIHVPDLGFWVSGIWAPLCSVICLTVSHKAAVKMPTQDLQAHLKLCGCWQHPFLNRAGLSSSLTDGQRLPRVPCHMVGPSSKPASPEGNKVCQQDRSHFLQPNRGSNTHHTGHPIVQKQVTRSSPLAEGRIIEGHEYQKAGIIGTFATFGNGKMLGTERRDGRVLGRVLKL